MSHVDYYRGLERAQQSLQGLPDADPANGARAVHAAVDTMLAADQDPPPRACHRGCSACCHFPVGVTFAEATLLRHHLVSQPALGERMLAAANATAAVRWADLAGQPCPLLVDGACAAYGVRPLPCRALASSDAEACARSLHESRPVAVPFAEADFSVGLGAAAALRTAYPPAVTRELRAALAAMLLASETGRAAAFVATRGPG